MPSYNIFLLNQGAIYLNQGPVEITDLDYLPLYRCETPL